MEATHCPQLCLFHLPEGRDTSWSSSLPDMTPNTFPAQAWSLHRVGPWSICVGCMLWDELVGTKGRCLVIPQIHFSPFNKGSNCFTYFF